MASKAESAGATRGGLNFMKSCTTIAILASQTSPSGAYADFTTSGNVLASATLNPASFTLTGSNGAAQVCTVAQQSSLTITNSGTATVIGLTDGTDWIMTTISGTPQALTANGSNTVTIQSFSKTINPPT